MSKGLYTKLKITLEGGKYPLTLSFRVSSHSAAQKWAACLAKAQHESTLLEDKRWYNFPGKKLSSLEDIAIQLNAVITQLNHLHPGLITEFPDPENLQGSVNRLHTHFADSHLVKNRITDASHDIWFEFNNLLHAFETVERSKQLESTSSVPNASIVFTWQDNFKTALTDSDYSEFTVAKKFGTCYVNYCQVGRHLFEMFQAQDHDLSDEHILPLRFVSADTYMWFGPSTGPQGYRRKMDGIEKWFSENKTYFESLGLNWGDPKLAIGWIPVASLEQAPQSAHEQNELIQQIGQQDRIALCRVD